MPPLPPDQRDRQDAARQRQEPDLSGAVPRERLQRAIIWANITDDAVDQAEQYAHGWTHLVTADVGVWTPDRGQLDRLRRLGPVRSWADCRPRPDGTPAQWAIDLCRELSLDGWVGQAESIGELEHAAGISPDGGIVAPYGEQRARMIVGNPNAWTAGQRATANRMIEAGDLSVAGEVYSGEVATYSAGGVNIDSFDLGVAMDKGVRYPLAELLAQTPESARSTVCVWHGAGLLPADWEALNAL